MRKRLVAAVALAPLCLAAGHGVALAQVTVTGGNNVSTGAASSSGPADLDITGTVGSSSSTPAVTLNSNNSVLVTGAANISGVNNSTAVLIDTSKNALTGSVTNDGTISNSESFTPSTNSDGFNDAPFASTTSTGRYGIRLSGANGLTGDILNAGTISVQGDTSAAISIEAPLLGSQAPTSGVNAVGLVNTGTISYTGDTGAAIQSTTAGRIGGNVLIEGPVASLGQQSKAIDLEGGVGGRFSVYSSITSTGYASSTRPPTTSSLQSVQSNADQVEQSAGAVVLNGGVGGGIFIGAPPVGTTTTTATTVDTDGDGFSDVVEGVGTIVNYGSASALSIGNAATGTVTIGAVGGSDTTPGTPAETDPTTGQPISANNYGVIIRGAISGEGTYDGVTASALQIGSGDTTRQVSVVGGVRVVGSVSADSFLANATAINILAGATVPEIRNENFIESSISNSVATGANTAGLVNANAVSTGISIAQGATVSTLSNYGTLQATANGDTMKAVAVVDSGGKLSNILNEGVISATVTPVTSGLVTPNGADTALNLQSNNTGGVTLVQKINPSPIAIEVDTTTSASGVVTTTAALTTATATTTTTTTTTTAGVTTTTTTTTPTTPQIIGDVLLGDGSNTVQILGGSVTGALAFDKGDGAGQGGTLTIGSDDAVNGSHVALFDGPLTFSGKGGLAINVVNGSLVNTSASNLNLSSLNVGAKGTLFAAIDPQQQGGTGQTNTTYTVSGAATLAQGAQIGIVLNSPLMNEQTFTIIKAGALNDMSGGTSLATANVPFVLVGTETSDPANNTISIDLRRRTAAEMGLNPAETAALNPIYASLANDPQIEQAVLGQYTRSSFLGVYDQLLPDYSGGVFELTLAASDAVTRATSRVNDIENPSGTRGAWAEEVAFGVNHDRGETAGYQGGGFGFVGGLEAGGAGLGAFGLTGSFLTGDIKDPHAPGDNLASFSEGEFGGYWQAQLGGLRADARLAGGYVLYSERRELLVKDATGNISLDRSSKASSSGYSATGHFGLGYQTGPIGMFYFRPQVHGDYFYLNEGGFTEHGGASGGSDGFDLAVSQRNGNEASGTVSLVTGLTFGQGFRWRPELELGYRDVFTGTAGDTTARFAAGGNAFTLSPDDIKGGGPVARLDVKADTDFYELNFEAGAEQRTHFTEGDLRLSVRVLF
jgi:hypothetical protein